MVDLPDDCACVRRSAGAADSPRCRMWESVATLSDGARDGAGVVNVCRCLCRQGGSRRQHVEASETGVAAGRSGGNPEAVRYGNGEHWNVRRLRSEYGALPRRCLVRCSRGKGLDRDSPVLLIRMETTRANSLWQAADMRPEPENNKRGRREKKRVPRLSQGLWLR